MVGTHRNCVCERRGLGKVSEGKGVTTETEGNDQHIDVSLELLLVAVYYTFSPIAVLDEAFIWCCTEGLRFPSGRSAVAIVRARDL